MKHTHRFAAVILPKLKRARLHQLVPLALLLFFAGLITIYSAGWSHKIWDRDPGRGAATVARDEFGDHFERVKYLDQGWTPSDSLWFYTTTQGSDLIPYDFFLALERADANERFFTPENMNGYRYLAQKPTSSNPDGLPVGMVADTYKGRKYMGFTCAACHTAQINYQGTGIRIDGGQGGADMDRFMTDLGKALAALGDPANADKKQRFVAAVLSRGNYKTADEVAADLKTYTLRVGTYNFINRTDTAYGYGRLDAFGRIFNRVAEHVLTEKELREALQKLRDEPGSTLTQAKLDVILQDFRRVLTDQHRDHLVERLEVLLDKKQQGALRDMLFNVPNAPVSYPFLWDTPQHDYVQWNGVASNAGEGPIGRNSGEVIGVFATLDWAEEPGWTLSSAIGGQGFGPTHIKFDSSVDLHNLRLLEAQLATLESPQWPGDTLPPVEAESAKRGALLFQQRCAECHQNINRADPDRHVIARFSRLSEAGTDTRMALNAIARTGYAGILTNQYVNVGAGNLYLKDRQPVAALLMQADLNVVATPDPDKWFFQRWADWAHDLAVTYLGNQVKPSIKSGDFEADTNAAPLASLKSYKARALNGIWATAPYLHNGSVPTLYDLLLPAQREPGDPRGLEDRPETFHTGSREFDPVRVGFRSQGYEGFLFNTRLDGNHNDGHEYGTRDVKVNGTVVEKALTREQRMDLVEYMKTL